MRISDWSSDVCSSDLGEGLVVDGEVRCPLHHACFSLRTGAALRAPAFAPLATWHTQVVGDTVFVRAKRDEAPTPAPGPRVEPGAIVIVGGGAAGFAAAQRPRELGFGGRPARPSAGGDAATDRPPLSTGYLAGAAGDSW